MKVYISADIEGVAGITDWSEARKEHADYRPFQQQMTREVAAACEGALAAGATEIVVKDAHGTARNLDARALPAPTRLIRGWSGHPDMMVQDIDDGFAAACFVGYHGRAGVGGNPLAHTISSARVHEIRVNGVAASEYRIHAMACARHGVPVAFVSGDATLAEEVDADGLGTRTVVTKWGEGASQQSLHPDDAAERIRSGVKSALQRVPPGRTFPLPDRYAVEICFKQHTTAYQRSFYPGARLLDPHTVAIEVEDCFEMLRALSFLI